MVIIEANTTPTCDAHYMYREVTEDTAPATQIIDIPCHDSDSGLDGEMTFSIIADDSGGAFQIEATSGSAILVTQSELDFDVVPNFFNVSCFHACCYLTFMGREICFSSDSYFRTLPLFYGAVCVSKVLIYP